MSPADTDEVVACTTRSLSSDEILKVIALTAFYTSHTVQK